MPYSKDINGIRSFHQDAVFYQRFTKYFSKTSRPLASLLQNHVTSSLDNNCVDAFDVLKKSLIHALINKYRDYAIRVNW